MCLYKTTSLDFADRVEKALIALGKKNYPAKVENERDGGAGREGEKEPKIVYVAVRK